VNLDCQRVSRHVIYIQYIMNYKDYKVHDSKVGCFVSDDNGI
jgi:ribosomal protein S17